MSQNGIQNSSWSWILIHKLGDVYTQSHPSLFPTPVIIQFLLKCTLIRKHQVLYEGVARAGRQQLLNTIYVEPEVSTCGRGAIDPWHEVRPLPPTPPPPLPGPDTFVKVNNLFRTRKDNGEFMRTVLTTALPGYGLSVIVGKFCLDWAEERANKVRTISVLNEMKNE